MRRIRIIVFAVLATVLQVNAQVPTSTDTITTVMDTVKKEQAIQEHPQITPKRSSKRDAGKKESTEKSRHQLPKVDTVVPGQKTSVETETGQTQEPKQSWWQKHGKKNDSQQCESQLEQAKKDIDDLQKQLNGFETMLNSTKAVYEIDDRDFFRSLITAPLERKYDSVQVDCYKKTVALFDHENKKEMKWVYEVYYPLLENYGKYNRNVAELIERVIKSFELLGVPDPKIEKELFNDDLEKTEYFKKYRYIGVNSQKKDNPSRRIGYLEDVISETRALFDDNAKFTKENFEEQLRRLRK